jgi:hypothetical protein
MNRLETDTDPHVECAATPKQHRLHQAINVSQHESALDENVVADVGAPRPGQSMDQVKGIQIKRKEERSSM